MHSKGSRTRRPSPAMVVAVIALIVALGGTATAATLITSSRQIKSNVVNSGDIKDREVRGRDIRDRTIDPVDLSPRVRDALFPAATAREAFRRAGPTDVPSEGGRMYRVTSLRDLVEGEYVIWAKATVNPTQNTTAANAKCTLDAAGDTDTAFQSVGASASFGPGTLNLQITRRIPAGGDVSLDCGMFAENKGLNVTNASIIAVRLEDVQRGEVID